MNIFESFVAFSQCLSIKCMLNSVISHKSELINMELTRPCLILTHIQLLIDTDMSTVLDIKDLLCWFVQSLDFLWWRIFVLTSSISDTLNSIIRHQIWVDKMETRFNIFFLVMANFEVLFGHEYNTEKYSVLVCAILICVRWDMLWLTG